MPDATTRVTAVTTLPQQLGGGRTFAQMWNIFSSETLVSTGEIDSVGNGGSTGSFGITIPLGAWFGLWISATGTTGGTTGIPNYTVSLLQSYSDTSTAAYVAPGARVWVSSGASAGSTAVTYNDHSPHVLALSPVPLPFARIRVTNATTSTGTVSVNAFLWAVK